MRPILILIYLLAPLLASAGTLDIYGELTGKTVLMSSAIPILDDNMLADLPTEKTAAIARIESVLSKQGIAVLQDGPHFVILFRESQRASLTNTLSLRGAELAAAKSQDTTPAGTISFVNVDAGQVLRLYAEMSRRTILRPLALPPVIVRLKTASPLSREEVFYAIETVLALNGIAVVEDGAKFVQVVPMAQRSMVAARAPEPEPGAPLLDPNQVPSAGNDEPSSPFLRQERGLERPDRSAQRLLEYYASLAEKTPEQADQLGAMHIWFHVETPLTKSELMYAIETTFNLNWLGIVQVDDTRIRLAHITERGLRAGEQERNRKPGQ